MLPGSIVALAPAAGAGIGKLLADRLLGDPEFVSLMVAAAKNGLTATRTFYSNEHKSHVTEPDYRVQLQAVALLLAHMEGEPVKRVIHQHLGGAGAIDPLAALQESPALREAAKRLLEKAEWRTSGQQSAKTPRHAEPATIEVD